MSADEKNHTPPNPSTEESWLRAAAAAPAATPKAAEQLSPLAAARLLKLGAPATLEERYTIEQEFARGGLGRVVRAYDRKLDRTVALKELLSPNQKARDRFLREVRLAARLEHPSIIPIHDLGIRPNGEPYYAMRLIDGRPLNKAIADASTPSERLALLTHVIDACRAIAYAHSRGVIHRDLKPHNIMAGAFGETLVIDWGLAKDLSQPEPSAPTEPQPYRSEPSADLTSTGTILGTPAYMPPEQARGELVDKRADVYSLGAILYHLLAGHPPYEGKLAHDTLTRAIQGPPPPLEQTAPGAPRELRSIVRRAMARAPEERYPDAASLLEELLQFQQGKLVAAHDYSPHELVRRWIKKYRAPLAAASLALLAAGTSISFSFRDIRASRDAERAAKEEALSKQQHAEEQEKKALAAQASAHQALSALLAKQGGDALREGDFERAAVHLSDAYGYAAQPSDALQIQMGMVERELPRFLTGNVVSATLSEGRAFLVLRDCTIQQRSLRTWEVLSEFGTFGTCIGADFHLASGRIVLREQDDTFSLWDIPSQAQLWKTNTHYDTVQFSADGTRLFFSSDQGSRAVETATNQSEKYLPAAGPSAQIPRADKTHTWSVSADQTRALSQNGYGVQLISLPRLEEVFSFTPNPGEVEFLLSPNGSKIVSRQQQASAATLFVRTANGRTSTLSIPGVTASALLAVGDQEDAFLFDEGQGQILKVSLQGGEILTRYQMPTPHRVTEVTRSKNGKFLSVAQENGALSRFDLVRGVRLHTFLQAGPLQDEDEPSALFISQQQHTLKLWSNAPVRRTWGLYEYGDAQFVSSAGSVVSTTKESIFVWDANSAEVIGSFPRVSSDTNELLIDQNQEIVLIPNADQTQTRFFLGEKKALLPLSAALAPTEKNSVPSQDWFANSQDGIVQLRHTQHEVPPWTFSGTGPSVSPLRLLAGYCAPSGALEILDLRTNETIKTTVSQTGGNCDTQWSPNGKWLLQKGSEPHLLLVAPETRSSAEVEATVLGKTSWRPVPKQQFKDLIRRTIRRNMIAIRFCYQESQQPLPEVATLHLLVSAQGVVIESKILEGNKPAHQCVARVARNIRFAESASPAEIIYPLAFISPDQTVGGELAAAPPPPARAPQVHIFELDTVEVETPTSLRLTQDVKLSLAEQAALSFLRGQFEESLSLYRELQQQTEELSSLIEIQIEICTITKDNVKSNDYYQNNINEVQKLLSLWQQVASTDVQKARELAPDVSNVIKELALSWHAEYQRGKNRRTPDYIQLLYKWYLQFFGTGEYAETMRWNRAELFYSMGQWSDAALEYQNILRDSVDGKYDERAAQQLEIAKKNIALLPEEN